MFRKNKKKNGFWDAPHEMRWQPLLNPGAGIHRDRPLKAAEKREPIKAITGGTANASRAGKRRKKRHWQKTVQGGAIRRFAIENRAIPAW